jgi:hypothetical protein
MLNFFPLVKKRTKMSAYHDTITITFAAGPGGKDNMEATYSFGANPKDLLGDPEQTRQEPGTYASTLKREHRTRHLAPKLRKLSTFHEVQWWENGDENEVSGPTSLLSKFWEDLVRECNLVLVSK